MYAILLTHWADIQGFTPCTDQQTINNFINEAVPYMQQNPNILAYAYSNGLGLGDVWPLMKGDSLRYVVSVTIYEIISSRRQ